MSRLTFGIMYKTVVICLFTDNTDEKLHRRSTVRMGIKVIQRAFAPPSPYFYVPGALSRISKGTSKQNKKTLLFNCRSRSRDQKYINEKTGTEYCFKNFVVWNFVSSTAYLQFVDYYKNINTCVLIWVVKLQNQHFMFTWNDNRFFSCIWYPFDVTNSFSL